MYNPTAKMQSPAGLYDMVSNLPPQQQGPELQQLGAKQLAPTEAILYVKNQLDRLRAARQPPSPTTVMQDMLAQIQQAQAPQQQPPMQQGPMQGPPPQQGPMQGPPPQQGLPSLPVQNVGQPQNYASGGIVAFQNRGLVPESTSPFERSLFVQPEQDSRMAENKKRFMLMNAVRQKYGPQAGAFGYFMDQSDEERAAAKQIISKVPNMSVGEMETLLSAGPAGVAKQQQLDSGKQMTDMILRQNETMEPPLSRPSELAAQPRRPSGLAALQEFTPTAERMAVPDKTQEDYLEEIQKQYAGLGIGKALEERGKYLEGRGSKIEKDLADRARMSRAQAFFRMAEEGGKSGGTFLKGAAAGLSQYAGDKQAAADRRDALDERTKELQFTLAQAQEQQKLGNNQAANALFKEAAQRKEDLADKATAFAQQRTLLSEELDARKEAAGLERGSRMQIAQLGVDQDMRVAAAALAKGQALSAKERADLMLKLEASPEVQRALDAVDASLNKKSKGLLGTEEGQRLRELGRDEVFKKAAAKLGLSPTSGNPFAAELARRGK